MTGAIAITWGAAVRGREAKGLECFQKALAYWDDLTKQGRVHGHREYIKLVGGGNLGLMVVDGELDELLKLQGEDATRQLLAEAGQITEDLSVEIYVGGTEATIQQSVGEYLTALQTVGAI